MSNPLEVFVVSAWSHMKCLAGLAARCTANVCRKVNTALNSQVTYQYRLIEGVITCDTPE
jgi:hypothetical protein